VTGINQHQIALLKNILEFNLNNGVAAPVINIPKFNNTDAIWGQTGSKIMTCFDKVFRLFKIDLLFFSGT
jgi:hypothetical protein